MHAGIDWSIKGALDARGLILDGDGNVIARPYRKFFNLDQLNDYDINGVATRRNLPEEILELDQWENGPYVTTEKVDGSLIIVFVYRDEIMFASSGSFTSEHAKKAKALFYIQFNTYQISEMKNIMNDCTMLFELVSPNFQIVIHYAVEKLILHGIINTKTSANSLTETLEFADGLDIERIKVYDYTKDYLLKIKAENTEIEGFVLRFESGKFLKIKTDDYFEKSYSNEFYISDMFTKAKLITIVNAVIDDTFDDLMLGAEGRTNAKLQLGQVYKFVIDARHELQVHKDFWEDGAYPEPKEIATNPKYKDVKHLIFLAKSPEARWTKFILNKTLSKFVRTK